MRIWKLAVVVGALGTAVGCGRPVDVADAAVELPDGGLDAGAPDGGAVDSGASDAGAPDAGPPDAGQADAGQADAGIPQFQDDPLPGGPALWLKADLTAPKSPRLEVWAQAVSPVLGLAFHLTVNPAQLRVDSAAAEPVLGVGARYLQRIRGGDVAFGLVHPGAASGQTALTAPTRVAVLQLTALTAVDSRIALERVSARASSGAFVPLTPAAGRLVIPGVQ